MSQTSQAAKSGSATSGGAKPAASGGKKNGADRFAMLAHACAHWAGKPVTFLVCVAVVLLWAAAGPVFGYSDTWQLVINTSTTIITFLMVFLIQNTQNRDTMAIQIKLAELICNMQGAEDRLATAEDLSENELEALHQKYHGLAEQALDHLETRRKRNA